MKKRLAAALLALAMVPAVSACGGGANTSSGSGSGGSGLQLNIFNSKMEIQDQMQEMAKKYSEEKGIKVEVYYSSDTVAAHMSTRYASNEPYSIAMVDAKDIFSLGPEHAIDLSGEKWVGDTTQAISVDGKVLGFPVCVEARGVIYNGEVIKKIVPDFDPKKVATTEDFAALLSKLVDGGMAAPTGVMKEDWSLGAHYLQQVYEMHQDPDAFIAGIKDGSVKLADDEVFNKLMDTFDLLRDNNYAKASAISAEREVTEQKLAEGEIAFMFGGNWDWSVLNAYNYSNDMGMMPVPENLGSDYNTKLVGGGSKYFYIDNAVSAEEQQAAKDFLNWLVYEADGQDFLVNKCALVPAFSNITLAVSDPLGASVKSYADSGSLIPDYRYAPDDHYAKNGASFQKYLAGQIDRAALADEITAYWATAEVGAH